MELAGGSFRGSASGSFHGSFQGTGCTSIGFPETSIDHNAFPQPLHNLQVVSGNFHCFRASAHGSRFRGSARVLPWKPLPRKYMGASMEASTEATMAAFMFDFHCLHWGLLRFHESFQQLASLPWKLSHT